MFTTHLLSEKMNEINKKMDVPMDLLEEKKIAFAAHGERTIVFFPG